jgi:cobalt-zinc-cadmium efflux system outer membrane protein
MKFVLPVFLTFFALLNINAYTSLQAMAASVSRPAPSGQQTSRPESPEVQGEGIEEPGGVVSLKQALSLALMRNPQLESFSLEIRAREARIIQAGLLPNPGFELGINNVIGSGGIPRSEEAQTIFSLAQLFQLSGKRAKRVRLASEDRDLAKWDYESRRLDVLSEVNKAFVDTVAKQERVTLAEELVHLAEQSFDVVRSRVQAGKVSPIDETKAQAALFLVRIELLRARRELEAARKILAATWGSRAPAFTRVEGRLQLEAEILPFEQLSRHLDQNPDIARWDSEMEHRRASLTLEEANRIPDIILTGGITRFNATGENGFVFGLSMPIPVFNRNQGAIAEAKNRILKAQKERQAIFLRAQSGAAEAYQRLASAFEEGRTLRDQVLPSLQQAFDAVREGYFYGKFGFLDLLDSQRTLFESRARYLEALASYEKAVADMDRLTGKARLLVGPR